MYHIIALFKRMDHYCLRLNANRRLYEFTAVTDD